MTKEDELFNKGIIAFNNRQYYDAHEFWEDLWLNYKLEDAKFVQGLIQLAVSYFHFFNKNLNGARSMMKKCLTKFESYQRVRGVDVISLKRLEKISSVNVGKQAGGIAFWKTEN